MIDCLISFGSNLGDSEKIIASALIRLRERLQEREVIPITFIASKNFVTRPIGGPLDQDPFINGTVRVKSSQKPGKILQTLLDVEKEFGRDRRTRWDSRTLDLDLLLYGDLILVDASCQIPHPRMCFRQFVLYPAVEIAPDMVHPICGVNIQTLLNCVLDRSMDVLLATSEEKFSGVFNAINGQQWQASVTVSPFQDLSVWISKQPCHKLLVLDRVDRPLVEFLQQEKSTLSWHSGPVLILDNDPSEQMLVELSAAIETMKAI